MKATLLREALDESVQDDVCGTKNVSICRRVLIDLYLLQSITSYYEKTRGICGTLFFPPF